MHLGISRSSSNDGSLDIRDAPAAATVRHVPALEQYGSRAERAELPRRAQHIFDRGNRYPQRSSICVFPDREEKLASLALALHEEQRLRLGRIWREQRREGDELLYECVERLVL